MPESSSILFYIFGIGITLSDIASIATAISVVIGIFQLSAGRRVRVENAKRSAVKEAVGIAKLFERELIDGMSFLSFVCKKIGLTQYVKNNIPVDKPLEFTREEATQFCGSDCVHKLKSFEEKVTPDILNEAVFCNPKYKISAKKRDGADADPMGKTIDFRNKLLEYASTRIDILNKLEWAAMLINSNVAEGDAIYQSLHQVLFEFVHENYLHIATKNSESNICDQYYRNLITLYNTWIEKCTKQRCLECRSSKKIQRRNKRNRRKIYVSGSKI